MQTAESAKGTRCPTFEVETRGRVPTSPTGRARAAVGIRTVTPDEPISLLEKMRPRTPVAGMSRATPAYVGGAGERFALVAQQGSSVIAVASCERRHGPDIGTVVVVRSTDAPDAAVSLLLDHLIGSAADRGIRWLRWLLREPQLDLLDVVRRCGVAPVLHREGAFVVADTPIDARR